MAILYIERIFNVIKLCFRSLAGHSTYIVLLNIMNNGEQLDLTDHFQDLNAATLEYILITDKSFRRKG